MHSAAANRYPIVDILCLISIYMVFKSPIKCYVVLGIVTRPQARYKSAVILTAVHAKKVCNALFESILNHTRTIKHLRTMVGEYTYGLPRFLVVQ